MLKIAEYRNEPTEANAQLAASELNAVVIKEMSNKNQHEHIREIIAANPQCPSHILKTLSEDGSAAVRLLVAENLSTDPEIISKLSKDKLLVVRRSVAMNPNTPKRMSNQLIKNEETIRLFAEKH